MVQVVIDVLVLAIAGESTSQQPRKLANEICKKKFKIPLLVTKIYALSSMLLFPLSTKVDIVIDVEDICFAMK